MSKHLKFYLSLALALLILVYLPGQILLLLIALPLIYLISFVFGHAVAKHTPSRESF